MSALHDGRLHESRPALARYVAPLRRAAVDFAAEAGADELALENIALALSEALSNAVIHAYPGDGADGRVDVDAWKDDGCFVVMVGDGGRGMALPSESPGLGLGLPLIARVSERLEIEDGGPEAGVRLRMTFGLRGN